MIKRILLLKYIIVLLFTIISITFAQTWTQVGDDIDGEAFGDRSGYAVSLSSDGKRVAIGATDNDGPGSLPFDIDYGHVRIYSESSGIWTQVGNDIDGEAKNDFFGKSVALSTNGKNVAIGAWNGGTSNGGNVRIFSETGGVWTQLGNSIDNEHFNDVLGFSVSWSLDGSRLAVGAIGRLGGKVRIFSLVDDVWTQIGSTIYGEASGDHSGYSVSLSFDGKRVAVGATGHEVNGIQSVGHARIFSETEGVWTQIGNNLEGGEWYDNFGSSVSLSSDGKRVAIGANQDDGTYTKHGYVRIFSESGGVWTQVGSTIYGEAPGDWSGISVSLLSDGTKVAIGANYNDGGGNRKGHVRVYTEYGGNWIQEGDDIDGEADYDNFGYSVSLSSDGSRLAIGAATNDGTAETAGHVRIFEAIPPDPCENGSIIYNTDTGKFNFCEDGVWVEK